VVLPSELLPIPTVTPWDLTPLYYCECGPVTAVSPRLPRYSRRPHYRVDLYFTWWRLQRCWCITELLLCFYHCASYARSLFGRCWSLRKFPRTKNFARKIDWNRKDNGEKELLLVRRLSAMCKFLSVVNKTLHISHCYFYVFVYCVCSCYNVIKNTELWLAESRSCDRR